MVCYIQKQRVIILFENKHGKKLPQEGNYNPNLKLLARS